MTSCDYIILTLTLSFQIFLFHCILFLFLLSRSDDDLDSEVEEVLYSQVHYASALLVSDDSTPGMIVSCLSNFSSRSEKTSVSGKKLKSSSPRCTAKIWNNQQKGTYSLLHFEIIDSNAMREAITFLDFQQSSLSVL